MLFRDPKTGQVRVRKTRRRFDQERCPHELTFSCYKGYRFLEADRTRQWFIEALHDARQRWAVDLWAWVLMPEHAHLLLAPREPEIEIGRVCGAVKQSVARNAIRWLEQNAPQWIPRITVVDGQRVRRRFWQSGGGYDRNVDSLNTLQSMIEYIHMNPVRRGLVQRPEEWEWSSARWYAGNTAVPIEMDRTLPTFEG